MEPQEIDDVRLESIILKYFIIGSLLIGCGVEKEPTSTIPTPEKTTWVEIKPLVVSECARCHNGVKHPLNLETEDKFNQPKVKTRIENGSMPPDRKLAGADKQKLLGYF